MGDESREGQSGKGFSGLSSMVSDVEAAVANAEKASRAAVDASGSVGQGETAPQRQPTDAPQPRSEAYQQTSSQPSSSGGSSAGKWLLGIGAVIGVIWVLSESGNKSTPPSPTYTPSPQPPVTSSPVPSLQPPPAAPRPQTPSRPSEEKPPVGTDLVLSVPQIRYCAAEDIRLDAAKGVINNYVEAEVDRFNAMVADYNSRCGQFRYRRGALESAKSDIENVRALLQTEGRNRFVRTPGASRQGNVPLFAQPEPDATVLAVQRQLNRLGYDAGIPDGLAGARTRSAIVAFQAGQGLLQDGTATPALLARLSSIASASPSFNPPQSEALSTPRESPIQRPGPVAREPSRDPENFRKCIDGRYPSLCNHALLTPEEATRVEAAERRANFEKCIDGRYPSLCNHSLLTPQEATRVDVAERQANFAKCIDGRYPSLCNHALLTSDEANRVRAAELRANLEKCIDGRYPSLCNHSLLTPEQASRVSEAEVRARAGRR